MDIKNILGYVLAGIGLLLIVFSSEKGKTFAPFLSAVKTSHLIIAGIVFVAAGVLLMIMTGKSSSKNQKQKEVPIYEGKGKKRTVVGYQREK